MVFVEIQEEQNEDGMEEDGTEIEFIKSISWETVQLNLNICHNENEKCSELFLISRTCKGHILVPVKPPLA